MGRILAFTFISIFLFMICFICICICLVICYGIIIIRRLTPRRRLIHHQTQFDQPFKVDLSAFFLITKMKDIENPNKNDTCSVCLDGFGESENVSLMVMCGHIFHEKCIMDWVNAKYCCPNCKFEIKKEKIEEAIQRKKEFIAKSLKSEENVFLKQI